MMNRSDRDDLLQTLLTTKQRIEQIAKTLFLRKVPAVADTLQKVCDALEKTLSKEHAAFYTESLLSLVNVMQGFETQKMPVRDRIESLKLMGDIIDEVSRKLAQETEIKKEIYFLPYKASMWDSLESIWRAAAEDKEHCNAYVMPIPYADRNPDGTAAEWHCERDLFPADVPVVNWEDVDLETVHPDVIYIHNPYDGGNRVTSVDSRYYSDNLRKYCDKLVYVPYFIIGEKWPDSHTNLPCYKNCDYILVQREHILLGRAGLSSTKEMDELLLEDYIPVNKLLPLGTPKIDRLFYCEQHKDIPKEWERFINGRKVLFYNTSISGLLQNGEQFLNKMKYIFECCRDNSDIVIVWRPHPLLESTLSSMRPDIYELYKDLKASFIEEKIGLFDETADIGMAVAIADAYIGESTSSVIALFGYMGKPIFFTDNVYIVKKTENDERNSAFITGVFSMETGRYVYAENFNALCWLDRMDYSLKPLHKFNEYSTGSGAFGAIYKQDSKIWLSPGKAKEIVCYDETTNEVTKIPYASPLKYGNFGGIIPFEKYLFFIGNRYPAIMRIDTESMELDYYNDGLTELSQLDTGFHDEFFGGTVLLGEELILASHCTNRIISFDLAKHEFHSFGEVGSALADCSGIIAENNDVLWLFPYRSHYIRRWNRKTGECEIIDQYPEGFICEEDRFTGEPCFFSGIIPLDGYVWLLPAYSNMILRLNMKEKTIEEVKLKLPHLLDERKTAFYNRQSPFSAAILTGEHEITVQAAYDNSLWVIDTDSLTVAVKPCRFSNEDAERLLRPIAEEFGECVGFPWAAVENTTNCTIDDYLKYVAAGQHDCMKQQELYGKIAINGDGSCGRKVHKFIMEKI